jgi:hypothetical protein
MMLDPIAMNLANQATRQLANSARPHAPVRPDQPPRPRNRLRADRPRLLIATMLRRLANRIEPAAVRTCQPSA